MSMQEDASLSLFYEVQKQLQGEIVLAGHEIRVAQNNLLVLKTTENLVSSFLIDYKNNPATPEIQSGLKLMLAPTGSLVSQMAIKYSSASDLTEKTILAAQTQNRPNQHGQIAAWSFVSER